MNQLYQVVWIGKSKDKEAKMSVESILSFIGDHVAISAVVAWLVIQFNTNLLALGHSLITSLNHWVISKIKSPHIKVLIEAAFEIVDDLYDFTVKDLKAKAADGEITKAECKELLKDVKVEAVKRLREVFNAKLPNFAKKLFGTAIDKYLGSMIEDAIGVRKTTRSVKKLNP